MLFFFNGELGAQDVAQSVKCLPQKCEGLGLTLRTHTKASSVAAHIYNPGVGEVVRGWVLGVLLISLL